MLGYSNFYPGVLFTAAGASDISRAVFEISRTLERGAITLDAVFSSSPPGLNLFGADNRDPDPFGDIAAAEIAAETNIPQHMVW